MFGFPPCPVQRLRPYPRVLLRRMSARFKDYDKTPIGFGIAVFCIARNNARCVGVGGVESGSPPTPPHTPQNGTNGCNSVGATAPCAPPA